MLDILLEKFRISLERTNRKSAELPSVGKTTLMDEDRGEVPFRVAFASVLQPVALAQQIQPVVQVHCSARMKTTQQSHDDMLIVLREKTFERLVIKRLGSVCYLVVTSEGEAHVFVDRKGKRKEYRHAWQVRKWLMDSFNIPSESVPVEQISQ